MQFSISRQPYFFEEFAAGIAPIKKIKQCDKEKNILIHIFFYACACDDVAFTTLNTFGVLRKYEHVTNNIACV